MFSNLCVNRFYFNILANNFPGKAWFLHHSSRVSLSGVLFFLPVSQRRAELWQLHFVALKCECLPRLEGVSQFLSLTFDFLWQPGWISAIFHVAQGLTLTNRIGYSAGMAGNPWWWDLFMLSVHSLKTVGLSSCLECVQQCYNRGELRPLLLKAQSSSFIEPPPWSVLSTASSLCCFKYCNNDM